MFIVSRWGRPARPAIVAFAFALASGAASAQTRSNPNCPVEKVFYDPGHGDDIVVPKGFEVLVIESGKGLPAGNQCNDNDTVLTGGTFSATNPFTPDLVVFDQNGNKVAGPIGKPTAPGSRSFQVDGPAIGLAFEDGFQGGTLFGTDSNQGARGAAAGKGGGNNTSRVVTIDLATGTVNPFISGLPTGDHPTELIVVKDGFIYWSQGSATNSGVTGHDNGNGGNQ